ncbi:hypothetical protein AB6A40_002709 [Gnathostoma spinigerum]|uniref:KAT8 regulatory NSL complex subunit 2 n=1 Tax=Gnathostoma spinigerum TaxID=75299 RepID=A0ABD6E8J1_9BILA
MLDSLGGGYTENTESVRLDAKASSSEIPISKKAHRRALVYEKLTSHPDSVNFRRCKYVSRRTQLACPNFCRASTHPRTIFCDEHRRYIQRLKTYADNEKKLNDLDLWIANHTDAEGSVDVCNCDDESLNVPRRPFSFEEHNYLPLDSGFPSQPFSGMDIMTEEEVLLKKISLLERKRDEIVRYRRSLAEDYGRRAKLFEMELNEEELKGKLTARTKKQKRLLDAHRCNEKYNQWKHSPIFLHAKECAKYRLKKRKLDSMATSNDDLDYLKIDYATYSTGKICAHKGTESTSETKKEGTSPAEGISNVKGVSEENVSENVTKDEGSSEPGINQPEEVTDENILKSGCKGCTSSAMLFSDFCSKHILDDPNQKLFVECSECGAPTIGREDGPSFCVTHMSVQPAHATLIGPYTAQTLTVRDVLTGFSSLRPSNQDLISSNISSAHSALASALNRAFESDELMKSQMQYRKRLAGGNFMGTTPLCASSEISLVPETTTKDLSDRQVQENATPVKKVVIDSDDEDLHASKDSSSLEKLPRNSSSR